MAKQKTVYFCSQCGHESSKWMGQCPACKQWNTFTEEKVTETKKRRGEVFKDFCLSYEYIRGNSRE